MPRFFRKNSPGFTLVETIVVAVIVAILAAVGIPIYSGYLRDQRMSTVSNLAQTAAAAANAYWRRTATNVTNTDCLPNNTLGLYYDNASYTISVSGTTISVNDLKHSDIYSTATYQ